MATALTGQTLGRYRILEPLGRGGMARVYRAYHAQLDRYVAVKVLRSDLVDDETFLTRFRREAQAVANLRHPNIIQVHDFDVQDDITYMVMELMDGDTLHTRLNDYRIREEQMPWGEMIRVLLDVCAGLDFAHRQGMVHRDIKPANILLTRQGQAVLADFGIAQIVGGTRHTVSGALLGTLNYMAPEQGLRGTSDTRSDIYSLGIVFFEMLARQPPYEADTPLAVLMKHVNDPLPLPRSLNPSTPLELETIVLKALSKEADDRYQTATELSAALIRGASAADIDVPDSISPPLSFSTEVAPAESVAVFSGTSRHKIADVDFAGQDTSATDISDVAADLARLKAKEPPVPAKTDMLVADAHPSVAPSTPRTGSQVTRAILNSIALLILGNLVIVMFSGSAGPGAFFRQGWPVELFLLAAGLCHIMAATGNVWMFIPGGIVLGNAVLLSFYALTGQWDYWSFLWPIEVFILLLVLLLTLNIAPRRRLAARFSKVAGHGLSAGSLLAVLILTVMVLAFFL